MKLDHIIVATDLSDSARLAYAHAAGLAKMSGARMTLLHVDDLDEFDLPEGAQAGIFRQQVDTLRREMLQRDLELLQGWVENVEVKVVKGRADKEIPAQCLALKADLLVLARYGLRGREPQSNSTTGPVISSVEVPVLVVDVPEELPTTLPEPHVYSHLMATTDFSVDSTKGLRVSIALAKQLEAKLTVAHVLRAPFFAHLELPPESMEHLKASSSETLEHALLELGVEASDDVEPCVVFGENPARRIARLATERGPELIIIPSHGKDARRSLIGYTTQSLTQSTPTSLLILPREHLNLL